MKFSIATSLLSVFISLVTLQVHASSPEIEGRLTCLDKESDNSVCWQLGVDFKQRESACEISAVITNGNCSHAYIRIVETSGLLKGQPIFERAIHCAYRGTNPNQQLPSIGFSNEEINGPYASQHFYTRDGKIFLGNAYRSARCVVQ